jgi:tetratricopeptide (TPR) repeat protein
MTSTLRLGLLVFFLFAAAPAPAEPPSLRGQALHDLDNPYPADRRTAVKQLAEVGLMEDTPALLKRLRDPDGATRALSEIALRRIWSRSGDKKVDALFRQGLAQMREGPLQEALQTFSLVIKLKPDFAEGWNKRATLYFVMGEYRKSLADCDEVIKRNPHHFGALAGYGQIYSRLNQPELALNYFRSALDINPNMHGIEFEIRKLERDIAEKLKRTI